MGRKESKPVIETVEYVYVGNNKQFNDFMKAVIRDYVSDDKIYPDNIEKANKKEENSA